MYLSLSLSLSLSSPLSFCWSGHVFSSPWSNVSKVKSLKDRSLKVFSKCHCHCLCLCICLCICLCCCVFVGLVMLLHDQHQFCKISVWSGRPEGFERYFSATIRIDQSAAAADGQINGRLCSSYIFPCCREKQKFSNYMMRVLPNSTLHPNLQSDQKK